MVADWVMLGYQSKEETKRRGKRKAKAGGIFVK